MAHAPTQKTTRSNPSLFLSVIVPLFDEEESLRELYEKVTSVAAQLRKPYELIFVDDGSGDRSFQLLTELHVKDSKVKVISFRRRFGKSAALSVGFHEARGKYVVTMDADLQDDPEEIPGLLASLDDRHDMISGWKKLRHDPLSKTISSRFFNFVTRLLTGIPIHDFNCGLKAYRSEVVKDLNIYGELHRYIPVLAHDAGYRVGEKAVRHHPRKYGRTKFGVSRFFRGFLDLLTILYTTRYIRRPLHLFGVWGIISFVIGAAIDMYLSIEWALGKTSLSNRPLFLVGFLFIIIGIQFVSIGLLGEMITRQQRSDEGYSIREMLK